MLKITLTDDQSNKNVYEMNILVKRKVKKDEHFLEDFMIVSVIIFVFIIICVLLHLYRNIKRC